MPCLAFARYGAPRRPIVLTFRNYYLPFYYARWMEQQGFAL